MNVREQIDAARNKTATVKVWKVIGAYLALAVAIVGGFWRMEVLYTRQEQAWRVGVSCAFEVILAPFPEAPTDVVHEALKSGGFPIVTAEQCVGLRDE